MKPTKPLGGKSYESIPHLPGSRRGPGDYGLEEGQARVLVERVRDRHDRVIVEEKVDGSNVGAARIDGGIVAVTRSGYPADTSPFAQHLVWAEWVREHEARFLDVLSDGERLCGEWLYQAHGTRYDLPHEPFVAFDLMRGTERLPHDALDGRLYGVFRRPWVLHDGGALDVNAAMTLLGEYGHHGAIDPAEGAVWRLERRVEMTPGRKGGGREWRGLQLAKYVRPSKVDGCYLESVTGGEPVLNTWRT